MSLLIIYLHEFICEPNILDFFPNSRISKTFLFNFIVYLKDSPHYG